MQILFISWEFSPNSEGSYRIIVGVTKFILILPAYMLHLRRLVLLDNNEAWHNTAIGIKRLFHFLINTTPAFVSMLKTL